MGYRVPETPGAGAQRACVAKRACGDCCRELGGQLEGQGRLGGSCGPSGEPDARSSRAHTEGVSCVRGKGTVLEEHLES